MHKPLARLSALAFVLALMASSALAQAFNVDLYATSPATVPSAAFGAASGQTGTWNGIDCFYCEPHLFPLVDVTGQMSGVTLEMTLGGAGEACSNPALTADENAFVSSGQRGADVFSAINASISGLAPGHYDVYVYASKPCGASTTTYVTAQIAIGNPTGNAFALQQQDSEGDVVGGVGFVEHGNFVRFRVRVEAGQRLFLHVLAQSTGWFSAHGLQLVPVAGDAIPMCFGTSGPTGCPCGGGAWERGCPWSQNSAGAGLFGSGTASVTSDSFVLSAGGMSSSVATFFQGTTSIDQGAGNVFGGGLRCAGGSVVRLGSKLSASGSATYPTAGDLPISVRGHVPAGGATRIYQVLYRDPFTTCTSATFNATNAVHVTWSP